jgi:hypothetical protein
VGHGGGNKAGGMISIAGRKEKGKKNWFERYRERGRV